MTKEWEQKNPFRPIRDFYLWSIEWQRTTGAILASVERTREAGLAKIADAAEREDELKTVGLGVRRDRT